MIRKSIRQAVVALVLAASMGGGVTLATHQPTHGSALTTCLQGGCGCWGGCRR